MLTCVLFLPRRQIGTTRVGAHGSFRRAKTVPLSLPPLPVSGTQDTLDESFRVYGEVNVRAELWKSQNLSKSQQLGHLGGSVG